MNRLPPTATRSLMGVINKDTHKHQFPSFHQRSAVNIGSVVVLLAKRFRSEDKPWNMEQRWRRRMRITRSKYSTREWNSRAIHDNLLCVNWILTSEDIERFHRPTHASPLLHLDSLTFQATHVSVSYGSTVVVGSNSSLQFTFTFAKVRLIFNPCL